MGVYHTSTIDSDAEANKYFHSPIGAIGGGLICPLRRVTFDGTSCLKIPFGTETPDVSFAGGQGTTAYADMLAAVGSYVDGDVAYCYSDDPAEHGRYVRTAGAWTRIGEQTPLFDYDDNHMKVTNDLILPLQSCFDTGHPAMVGGKAAYPNVTDMTDHVIRLTMRAVDFAFPLDFKLAMHLQGELDSAPRTGTGNGGLGSFPVVNAMNHFDWLNHLGSGNGGIYADNTVEYIADSGWVVGDVPISPDDAMWTMMLGNPDKDGHQGASYTGSNRYIGTTAARLVGSDTIKINSYLCGFRWNTRPGIEGTNTPRPRLLPDFEPTGALYLSKVEFVSP